MIIALLNFTCHSQSSKTKVINVVHIRKRTLMQRRRFRLRKMISKIVGIRNMSVENKHKLQSEKKEKQLT